MKNVNFDYAEFLKNLRKGNDIKLAIDMAESNTSLDLLAESHKAAPTGSDLWKELKTAASLGHTSMFTYPADCESVAGVKGETVNAEAEAIKIYISRVQNFARPMSWAADFFQEQNLANNEAPYYQNETMQAVRVAKTGQDGGYRTSHIVKNQSQVQVQLFLLSSARVKWRLFDLLAGEVGSENEKLVAIAADVALELDQRLAAVIAASGGAFNFSTGPDQLKTLNLHPAIVAANLPATNILPGLTAEGGVTENVITAAMQHCAKFGGIFPDGDVYPVGFYYPSALAMSNASRVTMNTTGGTAPLAEQVITRGFIETFLGRTFAHRPLASLGGKNVYVRTNKPLGTLYRKKGLDRILRKEEDENNEASTQARIACGFAVPESARINLIVIPVKP